MSKTTIPTAGLASDSVTTAKIADDAVTAAKAGFSAGKILQVQSADFTSGVTSVTSSTLGATEVTDQITPSATSSKVFITINISCGMYEGSGKALQAKVGIYRSIDGGTYSLIYAGQGNHYAGQSYGGVSNQEVSGSHPINLNYLDSPNTTSAVDYKLYIAYQSGDVINTGASDMGRSITLMEIGA